jgi:hypothetical protein
LFNDVDLRRINEMTTIPATTFSRRSFERGTVHRSSGFNQGLIFAAALYLAAPGIAEIGSLYVPVP